MRENRDRISAKQSEQGFSLVELAVVLTVMCVLATALVPNLIASTRHKLVERVAKDIATIQDAASYYFTQARDANGEQHWPGFSPACTVAQDAQGRDIDPLNELVAKGYLAGRNALKDPWGGTYSIGVLENTEGCSLQIKTEAGSIPASARNYLQAVSSNAHFNEISTRSGNKYFMTTTVPTPLAATLKIQAELGGGGTTFSTGIIEQGKDNHVGKDRKCFAYVHNYHGPCRGDGYSCRYDPETGDVSGAYRHGCGTVQCSWVCFD
jgi:prepilin-type N-terminal cleavage/methylation domain-containing protein